MNDRPPPPPLLPPEIEREERLEAMATTGRGPRRLVAAWRLSAESRRTDRMVRDHVPPAGTVQPAPKPKPARPPAKSQPRPKAPTQLTSARLLKSRSTSHARALKVPIDPAKRVAEEAAWDRWTSSEPVALVEPEGGWRQRVSEALDRLAESEVSRGSRIERAVRPSFVAGPPGTRRRA